MPTVVQEIRRVEGLLDANPLIAHISVELSLGADRAVLQLMEQYGLDSADAYHVDTLNVYTCDPLLPCK